MQQPGYTLLLLFCGLLFSATTMAENSHAQHPQTDADTAHHHHHDDGGELRLNQGEKWQTDKALRQGMRNIRSATEAAVQSAHASPGHHLDKQQAEILADQVNQQVEHIFAECKLSTEADAVLHGLLADMLQAAQQLRGHSVPGSQSPGQARLQALLKLQKSLDIYPQYFDDSEWQAE
jgi:hypothetical protein